MSTFLMAVGLPYSGKSVYAKGLREKFSAEIHSSDTIRAEILGNVQDQTDNQIVFNTLHKRAISDLSAGKSVICDATSINYKRRIDLLNRLSEVECQRVCIAMATPFRECEKYSKHRERIVPHKVPVRMHKNPWIPYWYEG